VLQVAKLNTFYGSLHMLKDVELTVGDKELVVVIGANGAGKTTLLRTLSGVVRSAQGDILFGDRQMIGMSADRIVGLGVCHVPEGREIFSQLTVRENLEMGAYLRKDKKGIVEDFGRVCDMFPRLKERLRQVAGTMSGGEQQMLAIARGLMSGPKLLLLDEPSLGLSPVMVEQLGETIRGIHREGTSILLVEQNAVLALELADRAYVLEVGHIVLSGTGDELLRQEEVRRAYLGL